ncbi:hypothetical protein [Psychrobacillus sp. FSL H8-0510]|uniref:hypothetical protein n=1 Tax=Psychrobacillus sp. FSL H8-0510 TaxID=2921394 RepID=UPI0030F7E39D
MGAIIQTNELYLGGILLQKGYIYVTVAFDKNLQPKEKMTQTLYKLMPEDSMVEGFAIAELFGRTIEKHQYSYEILEFPNKDQIEEDLQGSEYSYLVKDKNGKHYFAAHVGPCEPEPYYYIEDATDVESVFREIFGREDL